MARHRPDRRRVKIHRTYTVDETARLLAMAKGTVRRWLKHGLRKIDTRKQVLIRGSDLRDFLDTRSKPKQSCPPGCCFCVKCKTVNAPAGAMAEYVAITSTSGNLRGICPTCGNLMHRRISLAQLATINSRLEVTIVEQSPRLRERDNPSTTDH
jgi:excisionase family DNA binding protein